MACTTAPGSNFGSTTTVPPNAMLASASGPAACEIGAAARFTGGFFIGIEATRLETSACQLPFVSMTPFERPVVPPVLPRNASSSTRPWRRSGTRTGPDGTRSSRKKSAPGNGRSSAM